MIPRNILNEVVYDDLDIVFRDEQTPAEEMEISEKNWDEIERSMKSGNGDV